MTCGITLSGADERTKIDDMMRLADAGAEIAILLTHSPDGRNRYPRIGWIIDALRALGDRAAVHICGSRARAGFYRGSLNEMLEKAPRIQVNGTIGREELLKLCEWRFNQTIITQHNKGDALVYTVNTKNHAVLVDASGGRGKLPDQWASPDTCKPVGFAGGLTPKNLQEQLPKIAAVAKGNWWIDMESGLRDTDDWFDVGRAWQVMEIWKEWKGQV